MKVALVQSPFIPLNLEVCGGVERTVLAELDHLERAGCDVTLYVSGLSGGSDPRIRVIKSENPSHRLWMWPFYLRVLRAARDADVIHAHYAPPFALLDPRRTLVHLQGLAIGWLPYYGRVPRRYWSAHYVCCSQHTRTSFLERYPTLPAERVGVLYNGVDPELFAPPEKARNGPKVRMGYHSLWKEWKGVFDLLEAAAHLRQRGLDFELSLAGSAFFEGGDAAECEAVDRQVRAQAARLGNVEIVGALSHPQLAAHLRTLDIGVFPSRELEPFGIAAVEMMSTGLPVVGYDVAGLRETCPDGIAGYRVPPGNVRAMADKLERLVRDRSLRLAMGGRARQHVLGHFTWHHHIAGLLPLYEAIADGQAPRRAARSRV